MECLPYPDEWHGTPPQGSVQTSIEVACGGMEAVQHSGVIYADPKYGKVEPLFPLGRYINRWGLESFLRKLPNGQNEGYLKNVQHNLKYQYKWKNNCPYLYVHEVENLRNLSKADVLDRLNGKSARTEAILCRILDRYREQSKKLINDPQVYEVVTMKLENAELRAHKRGGHVTFRPDCPGCRTGSARSRAHHRLAESERPGGELSVDISGPHTTGRWPSDAPEAWAKRAMYFVVGAFKTYTEDEINEIAKNRLAAADASGSTTTQDPLTVVEEKGML